MPCASTHDTPSGAEGDCVDRRQAALVAGLRARLAAAGDVEVLETHISRVLLAGADAYKLKKPVNLGFLDFSTRAQRRHFAEEEVRLNRRLAPQLYLGVVPITGTPNAPELGGEGQVQDYAVHMRRFPQDALLTRHALTPEVTDVLAARIAAFHAAAPAAPPDSDYGAPAQVLAPMRENFAVIRDSLAPAGDLAAQLAKLEDWTQDQYQRLASALTARRQGGHIRECHGDLHRANIAVVEGEPLIFDCIEFNPALRWIDTASEVAFLIMDLAYAGEAEQGRRLLNAYLMHTGDYGALALLRFYLVYRAMVRAKVTAIGAAQHHHTDATQDEALRSYVREAQALSRRPPPPRLVMLCGLSGSGKTWLATRLCERLPLVHIRSDVERKRLFGLPPLARTEAGLGAGIYAPDATERTYARLLALTQQCLDAGYGVLVDATFLSAQRRRPFRELADAVGCPFDILALDGPAAVLRRRVLGRHAAGTDASEADLTVLDQQLADREPLTGTERDRAIFVDSSGGGALESLVRLLSD